MTIERLFITAPVLAHDLAPGLALGTGRRVELVARPYLQGARSIADVQPGTLAHACRDYAARQGAAEELASVGRTRDHRAAAVVEPPQPAAAAGDAGRGGVGNVRGDG